MNSLNSVLLEGKLVEEVERIEVRDETYNCLLTLKSERSYVKEEERVVKIRQL